MQTPQFNPAFREAELELMARDTKCTMCGKQFDEFDAQEGFGFDYLCGHGTKFQDRHINIKLCCECFDKVMDIAIPMCKGNPIIATERKAAGAMSTESLDRTIRLEKLLNEDKASQIISRLEKSKDKSAALFEIEKELTEQGFHFESVPLDQDEYWKNSRKAYLQANKKKNRSR